MKSKQGIFALFLSICLLFSACGSTLAPSTQVSPSPSILPPTPTPDLNKVTILQYSKFVPEQGSLVPQQLGGPGLELPEITVAGPCDAFGPPPNFLSGGSNAFSIPVNHVLVSEFVDNSEEITVTNGIGTPTGTISVNRFTTIAGPATFGVNEQTTTTTYTIVPKAQVGKTLAFMVASDFTADCTQINNVAYDCSLVSLGKQYPYPTRFKVEDPSCSR
jgi:hypothetical protein